MKALRVAHDPRGLADHQQNRAAEFEDRYPLTPGRTYPVAGMAIAERTFCFLIEDDWGIPGFVPAGFFKLFTASMPHGWLFRLEAGIHTSVPDLWSTRAVAVWGYPELVNDPDHVLALAEDRGEGRAVFRRYLALAESD